LRNVEFSVGLFVLREELSDSGVHG
jgi:hypothetical protein